MFGDRLRRRAGDALDADAGALLAKINDSARRMQVLVEDLLAYSRVALLPEQASGKTDLNRVVREVLTDLEGTIEQRSAVVDVQPLPTVVADATQMRQLFLNLLSNAVKFASPARAPMITIQVRRLDDDRCEVSVRDNGIGFEQRHAERIFELLQRLHPRTAYEGTGIGLSICRRIVERCGGTLTAVGEPGRGATFHFDLPLAPQGPVASLEAASHER
jgi:signal transduction histidine kinase